VVQHLNELALQGIVAGVVVDLIDDDLEAGGGKIASHNR
jgi:hypothetical protein